MHAMVSNKDVPPYNRFDRIPRHALQCGVPQSESNISQMNKQHCYSSTEGNLEMYGGLHGHTSNTHLDLGSYQPSYCNQHAHHLTKLDSTGSRNSIASTISTISQNSNDQISASKSSLDSLLSPNSDLSDRMQHSLYIEQSDPPPYNSRHETLESGSNFGQQQRSKLPQKSQAAKQSVAELLRDDKAVQLPYGTCYGCKKQIATVGEACQAMGQTYHNSCFTCCSCGRTLREKAFYSEHGKAYCQEDYMYAGFQHKMNKCFYCGHLIMDMILQAMGRSFHPGCFRCTECNECLDGIPFTVDINEKVYCINDYHRLFAPKCAGCGHIIVPIDGSEETVRVVALDRDYHVDCYHCEKCQVQLTDESDKRCYPIGDHLLCYNCHIDIRSSNLPSPSASSTSSGHSSSSYTLSHGRTSPTPNGHVGRKPPSPLTYPSPLLYNAIPEETADNTYNQSSAQINTQKLPNSVPSYNQAPFDSKSDPNQRLHEKTMHHMAANKDFKLRNSANAALSKKMIGNSLNQSSQSHTVSVPQVQGPELPEARAKFKSIITYTPKLPSTLLGATMTSNLTSVKAASAHKPVPQPPSATGLEERLPIAPRSVPIDHAVPQLNLKRMQGTRRRLPLGDFIMHKKIAESLKKSLNSGAKFSTLASSTKSRSPSPQSDVPAPLAQHSPSTTRTSPTPPLPYYMKAWQASEIAKSASTTDFPLAVAQDPVQSQELPPRLVARGQNQPPERPPKLKSIHIAKI